MIETGEIMSTPESLCVLCKKPLGIEQWCEEFAEEPKMTFGKFSGGNLVIFHKGDIVHSDCYHGKGV